MTRATAALALAAVAMASVAHAQQAPTTRPHPRILLDDEMRAQWKAAAKDSHSYVHAAIERCEAARADPNKYDHDDYMALDWAASLQACLVSWVATGRDDDARTATHFFTAILDDLSAVGDGKGGDDAVHRDSGFAMRVMGPNTAIAYDWLHDRLPEPLRAHARARWKAWTDWYKEKGYRPRDPGNNYHAGFVAGATLIAIAEAGEGGADGDALWHFVADEMWGKDMKAALAEGGILDGGDWIEGWQYGPLAVAEYSLAARAAAANGIAVPGASRWLEQLFTRAIHGLEPDQRAFARGDTESEQASLEPSALTLAAVAYGDAPPHVQAQALGELRRLDIKNKDFPLYVALAEGRKLPAETVARDTWPTAYLAGNSGVLYARTSWRDDAVWAAFVCAKSSETDHFHPDSGNVSVSRGKDEVIVDPSPYGTMSTMTSNAPSVLSLVFPDEYQPGQGFWSQSTGYTFATQTRSGTLAARCDYADSFRFADKPSDVKRALRDFVLVPWNNGTDASLVVIDRATTGPDRPMYLRFRTPARLVLDPNAGHGIATGTVGGSALVMQHLFASGGAPEVRHLDPSDCYKPGTVRGKCDASRLSVDELHTDVPGPSPAAVHVFDLAGKDAHPPAATIAGDAAHVITLPGRAHDPARVIVVADEPADPLAYHVTKPGPAGSEHVLLDAPLAGDGTVGVTARPDGDGCAVTLSSSGGALRVSGGPAAVLVDAACTVTDAAPRKAGAAPRIGPHPGNPTPRRGGGCCGASATPGSSVTMAVFVLLSFARPRRARTHT